MAKARIMVVEDEGVVALSLERSLQRLGYDVPLVVPSGEEAVEAVERTGPDLVLMDIWLTGEMDGVEAADQIHDRFNIPVVFLTAHADEETLQRAKITEPSGYLVKPFEERELHTTIETALYKHKADLERMRRVRQELTAKQGKVLGFIGAKGGVGTTTVALNIASVLATQKMSVVAVELRSYHGTFSPQLRHTAVANLNSLLELDPGRIGEREAGFE